MINKITPGILTTQEKSFTEEGLSLMVCVEEFLGGRYWGFDTWRRVQISKRGEKDGKMEGLSEERRRKT